MLFIRSGCNGSPSIHGDHTNGIAATAFPPDLGGPLEPRRSADTEPLLHNCDSQGTGCSPVAERAPRPAHPAQEAPPDATSKGDSPIAYDHRLVHGACRPHAPGVDAALKFVP